MTIRDVAFRLSREPLIHFFLAGAVVFALVSGRTADPVERRIVVNEVVVTRLVDRWVQTYRRSPTQAEIDGLIRDYVSDQIYYREGVRLGLDRDDEVVIRRMRVKMLAMASSVAETTTPADAELQRMIDTNPQRYASEPELDFYQLYLGADSVAVRETARILIARLSAGKPADMQLPPAPVGRYFGKMTPSQIAELFGDSFADTLRDLPPGEWRGPIVSGLGLHLVKIDGKRKSAPPRLADIRQRVENDWRSAAVDRAEEDRYREMAARYDIVIEPRK